MNRLMRMTRVVTVASLVLAGEAFASDNLAHAPQAPAVAYEFCYAFGSARDGSAMTYYTGVFQGPLNNQAEVQTAFRGFVADKYGSRPDPRSGDRDITCVSPSPSAEAAAQQASNTYVANMRKGGGKVVETGWKYDSPDARAGAGETDGTATAANESPRLYEICRAISATKPMNGKYTAYLSGVMVRRQANEAEYQSAFAAFIAAKFGEQAGAECGSANNEAEAQRMIDVTWQDNPAHQNYVKTGWTY